MLGWIAGWTERIGLGTSIVLLPLHHPFQLAKEAATLQELSRRPVTLGVGVGWHRDEFDFMGVPFRAADGVRTRRSGVMRALWSGERSFQGELLVVPRATSEPLPAPPPEIWVGGSSERAIRRARELGDVWHPSRGSAPSTSGASRSSTPSCA